MALRNRLEWILAVAAAALAGGSACAMNSPSIQPICIVEHGDRLPPETGGTAGLCAAIIKAAAEGTGGLPASVQVRVLSASRLSATVTLADGRVLPDQNMASSDRQLNSSSIERFAAAIAAEIARANQK
jgi:hypothetical protein